MLRNTIILRIFFFCILIIWEDSTKLTTFNVLISLIILISQTILQESLLGRGHFAPMYIELCRNNWPNLRPPPKLLKIFRFLFPGRGFL